MSTTPQDGEGQSVKAKVKEITGKVTGDREVEAEGRADATPDDDPASVDEAKQEVREDHGDVLPD
ncbi:MAG: hypothetical protein QOG03_2401 [Actinomycetota bacterium]|jgi:uncharacterized protein YjbJ (UPF0337 family)|nr:hypothetical protein [Actinomycetota bacterium]